MLSALSPPFIPAAAATTSTQVDADMIRQKRLQKFLLRCAKTGVHVPLDSKRQDNATFDTMLEVAAECEAIGIPETYIPVAKDYTLPPTPKTDTRDCCWTYAYTYDTTPSIPTDDGTLSEKDYPDFSRVLASKVGSQPKRYYLDTLCQAFIDHYMEPKSDEDMMTITEIMNKYGPGVPEGSDFHPETFGKAFVDEYYHPQNYWEGISFSTLMEIYGPFAR